MNHFKILILQTGLLLATPWFLTLILSRPSLLPPPRTLPWPQQISANIAYLTSDEFLFFSGDGRSGYGTGDHGMFLLSFLPLILVGTYSLATSRSSQAKWPVWWFLTGLGIAIIFGNVAGLPSALWYLPALSILATLGAHRLITTMLQCTVVIRLLLITNLFWLLYETALLYHTIIIHKPF